MSEPFDPSGLSSRASERVNMKDVPDPVATPHVATMSPFLPITILGLVLLAWFAFQATQLRAERDAIRDATASQEKQVDEAKKLRDAFYALAHGAEQLADVGNPGARVIVDGLKKRGVTIAPNPPAPAGGPDTAPSK